MGCFTEAGLLANSVAIKEFLKKMPERIPAFFLKYIFPSWLPGQGAILKLMNIKITGLHLHQNRYFLPRYQEYQKNW